MRILVIAAILCLFASCGGDADTSATHTDPEIPAESTDIVEEVPVEVPEEIEYRTIEDYCGIASKDQLIAEFGEENITDGESWYAEGTVCIQHSNLVNPENGHVIKYLWEEDGNTLSSIEVSYYIFDEDYSIQGTQIISSESGVNTGMSLQDLVAWNGDDFDFFGFGWDYEGGILSEEGSELGECPVQIKLSFDLETDIPEEYYGMYGDQVLSTADDNTVGAPVLVDRLTYYPPMAP